MKLLGVIIGWILSRLFLFICIAGVVIAAAVLRDWWNERKQQESQLQTLQTELGELHKTIKSKQADLSLERRYLDLRRQEPSRWTSPFQWYRWDQEMKVVAGLLNKKNSELKKLRQQRIELVRKVEDSSRALYETQRRFTGAVKKSIRTILIISGIVLFGPLLWKAFWYFVLAPIAKHASPVRITGTKAESNRLLVEESRKNLSVLLQPGERLVTRMAWLHQYTRSGTKRTRFLLDWKAPFISYASGLAELTEIAIPGDGTATEVVLSSAEDPDAYLCAIRLEDHPGLVVYPSQVVGLTGNLRVSARWKWWNLHSWISGRLRYILFSGTGSLFVRGTGGVHPIQVKDQPVRLSEPVLSAFESTLPFLTVRTETFWPYYRRLVPLFDYEFQGTGVVLRQTSTSRAATDSASLRVFDAFLSGVGKLFGL